MLQKYSRYKILQEFFDYPMRRFYIREISRNTKISQPTLIDHLKALIEEGVIIKESKGIYPTYMANRDSDIFKVYKKLNIILRIQQSDLLKYIEDNCFSKSIILFGSASLGEDTEESDIDLFVESKKKDINVTKYEKLLKRKINLFFEENFVRLSKELKNNILNGIVLRGYIKVY